MGRTASGGDAAATKSRSDGDAGVAGFAAEDEFFDFHGEEDEEAEGEDADPFGGAEGDGVKKCLQGRGVGEEGLENEQSGAGEEDGAAAEEAAPIPRGGDDIAAVEEVEHLADDEGVDGDGAGEFDARAGLRLDPEIVAEGSPDKEEGNEEDPPEQQRGQQGGVRSARGGVT